MSINSYLLSIFTENKPFEANVGSLADRNQVLAIFYVNFGLTSAITLFEILCSVFFHSDYAPGLSTVSIAGCITSIIFLKKRNPNAAGAAVMVYLHCANFFGGMLQNYPLAAIFACFSFLSYNYFLTKSSKMVAINSLITIVELCFYIRKTLNIFQITLTDEQSVQILSGLLATMFVIITNSLLSYYQKSMECNLWKLTTENYKKSENLTKEVIQSINSKDNFVSALSHEVRNVLNALNGSIDFLLSAMKNSLHVESLRNVKMSGEVLFNLVSNALDVSKIRADKLELTYNHANFQDVIKKAFLINSENLRSKNIIARALIDSRVPKNLWMDSGRLLQIMMNLMSNALKFTPRGGQIRVDVLWCKDKQISQDNLLDPIEQDLLKKTSISSSSTATSTSIIMNEDLQNLDLSVLEFSLDEEEARHKNLCKLQSFPSFECMPSRRSPTLLYSSDHWEIRTINLNQSENESPTHDESGFLKIQVSDTGCGIAKDNLPKLFDMYMQGDQNQILKNGGTGLGLWICKQLCHKMNGDISVYSQFDKGTKFVFYIPVDNLRKNAKELVLREKINALVVDDYDFNRNLHKLLLEREGVQVTLAHDGKEAVEKYQEKPEGHYDFIFMDISMPIMDGFEAAKEIRRWEEKNNRKEIMIYFVSGEYFNDSEIVGGLKNTGGVQDITKIRFMRKPIEVEMVAKIVKDHKDGQRINSFDV